MFRNHFYILFYHRFNHFQLRWFQTIVLNQTNREYSKLGTDIPLHNVYVNRPVIIGNLGNNFITGKYICKKNNGGPSTSSGTATIIGRKAHRSVWAYFTLWSLSLPKRRGSGEHWNIQRKVT